MEAVLLLRICCAQNTSVNMDRPCPLVDYILVREFQVGGIKRKLLFQCFREGGHKSQDGDEDLFFYKRCQEEPC